MPLMLDANCSGPGLLLCRHESRTSFEVILILIVQKSMFDILLHNHLFRRCYTFLAIYSFIYLSSPLCDIWKFGQITKIDVASLQAIAFSSS